MIDSMQFLDISSSRLSSRSSIPILQSIPTSVRTAKAERRLKEKMLQEVFDNFITINEKQMVEKTTY